jgi:hypothetical protein
LLLFDGRLPPDDDPPEGLLLLLLLFIEPEDGLELRSDFSYERDG